MEGPKVAPCKNYHEKAETAAKQAEQFYKQRDVDLPAVKAIVKNSAQILKVFMLKTQKYLVNTAL